MRGGLAGFRIFLACLALGVAAIAAVGSVRVSITEGLAREGGVILGGDAEVEFAYRRANDEERAVLGGFGTVSEVIDFRSMAATGDDAQADRALTQVKAVDALYPLVGTVELTPDISVAQALADGGVIAHPVLVDRLGLEIGDPFYIGAKALVLRAVLDREPDAGGDGFGLGPRTIVATSSLDGSGLLVEGSLFESKYRIAMPGATDESLDAARAQATEAFAETGMRWRDRRNAAPQVERFVDRIGSFLVLVGLAGLAVGGVGVSAAVRSYLDRKTGVIATLKTLGAEGRVIFAAYLMQIGVLAALGICLGLILGTLIPIVVGPFIEARLPVPVALGVHPGPLLEAALYGALTALIFTLWPLARTEQVRAASLFRDATGAVRVWPRRRYIAALAVAVVTLVGSSAILSGIPTLALYSAAGIALALGLLVLAAWGVRALSRRLATARWVRGRPALRLALGSVGGPGGDATAVVLSLGLGLTVLAAVGQIDANMRAAIDRDLPAIAPSYFFVDIQPEQLPAFLARVNGDPAVSRVDSAPMLGGIVRSVGGRPASEIDHWVTRGDRRISFADTPGEGTRVVAGEFWPPDYDGPPLISFAREEAEELGVKLGRPRHAQRARPRHHRHRDQLPGGGFLLGRDRLRDRVQHRSTRGRAAHLALDRLCRGERRGGDPARRGGRRAQHHRDPGARRHRHRDRSPRRAGGRDELGRGCHAADGVHRADRRGGGGRAVPHLRGGGAQDGGGHARHHPGELRAAVRPAGHGRRDRRHRGRRAGRMGHPDVRDEGSLRVRMALRAGHRAGWRAGDAACGARLRLAPLGGAARGGAARAGLRTTRCNVTGPGARGAGAARHCTPRVT